MIFLNFISDDSAYSIPINNINGFGVDSVTTNTKLYVLTSNEDERVLIVPNNSTDYKKRNLHYLNTILMRAILDAKDYTEDSISINAFINVLIKADFKKNVDDEYILELPWITIRITFSEIFNYISIRFNLKEDR